MPDSFSHRVHVRDKPGFLQRLMVEFVGGRISLEGDLSRCAFGDDVTVAHEEAGLLKRNTLQPRQDFVVLGLEPATIAPIFKQIVAAGLSRAIIHVQIEHSGMLQLGAYDNFHSECVVTGPAVSAALLAELKTARVVRSFEPAAKVE